MPGPRFIRNRWGWPAHSLIQTRDLSGLDLDPGVRRGGRGIECAKAPEPKPHLNALSPPRSAPQAYNTDQRLS
ncbi:hypothetical protein EIB18_04555 [Caulobacter vibrioides]|nr:hypothetical protein CA608_20140 [Caulobacter vibrioides]AZH12053.1 hypothetical protein EIB18_04555 [Caulobacter vibrioides]PLR15976.1 hypothetical protein CVUC_02470 [Caulobacter vibrioides]